MSDFFTSVKSGSFMIFSKASIAIPVMPPVDNPISDIGSHFSYCFEDLTLKVSDCFNVTEGFEDIELQGKLPSDFGHGLEGQFAGILESVLQNSQGRYTVWCYAW